MSYAPDKAVKYIVIHYSATAIEDDVSASDIDTMHKRRGFNEIGYHWYIRKNGLIEMGRDLSQPGRFEIGAHSKGENDEAIGICFEGGVRKTAMNTGFDSRTPAQIKSMIELIDRMQERFPGAIVKGHRDMPGAATSAQDLTLPHGGMRFSASDTRHRAALVLSSQQSSRLSLGGANERCNWTCHSPLWRGLCSRQCCRCKACG